MALEHEAEALAAQVERERRQRWTIFGKRIARMDTIGAYRRLFLDGDAVRPDAAAVLADIADQAELGRASSRGRPATDAELREREGARRLALHIISSLDLNGEQLRDLARKTKEQPK